jgi:hypothetical protein
VLHALGVSSNAALLAGSLSYPVMLIVGLLLAKRWAAELRSPELVVLVPTAAVLIGGVFIHDIQMAAALPAALVIADRVTERRALAFAGVALIAIPWGALDGFHLETSLSFVAILLLALDRRLAETPSARAAFAAAGCIAVLLVSLQVQPESTAVPPVLIEPSAIAGTNWQRYIEANARPVTFADVARKMLVWGGFLAIAFAAAGSKSALAEQPRAAAPRQVRIEPGTQTRRAVS